MNPTDHLLCSTTALATLLGQAHLLVVDCRFVLSDPTAGELAYQREHIPGAHYANLDRHLSGERTGRNGRHPLPDPEAFAGFLTELGHDQSKLLVAYDDSGGIFAARLWWLMRWLGFDNCRVLDGGWGKWKREALPCSADTPAPATGGRTTQISPINTLLVLAEEVLDLVEGRGDGLILDARSPDRFRGENETLDPVGGHIPGAKNHFYQLNLNEQACFKPASELRQNFLRLAGSRPADRIIHQCGSGVTACHNLLAMELAGLSGSRLYAGSWSEWCASARHPVSRGPD